MYLVAVILAQIGIAWLFIRYLINNDRGPKEPHRALIITGVLAALGVALAAFLEYKLLPDINPAHLSTYSRHFLLKNAMLVGLIEESCKVIPIAFFIYRKNYFNEVTDGLIYFGISGMVFGLLENIEYTIVYGSGTGIVRVLTMPFLHAGFCVLFGLALAYHKVLHKRIIWAIAGLTLAITAHGIYDFSLFTQTWWGALIAFAFTVILNASIPFWYRWATKKDVKLGLATEGDNLYCRTCGEPNPQHYMYCVICGQKT